MSIYAVKQWMRKKAVVLGMFVLFGAAAAGLSLYLPNNGVKADDSDCSSDYVLNCGASNLSQLETYYNDDTQGIRPIYSSAPFNINQPQMNDLASYDTSGQPNGYVSSNGDVNLNDGTLVATGANTAGRTAFGCDPSPTPGSYYQNYEPNSAGVYVRPTSCGFKPGVTSLPAFIDMKDINGVPVFQFAVLSSCANPVVGVPIIVPVMPTCTDVDVSESQDEDGNEVDATVHFNPNGNSFESASFDWGAKAPNSVVTTSTNNSASANHTYAYNAYQVLVTLTFNVDGKTVSIGGGGNCMAQGTFVGPTEQCVNLQLTESSTKPRYVDAQITYADSHGSAYKGAVISWGDGTSTTISGTEAPHQYAKDGTYNIDAVLNFEIWGKIYQINDAECQRSVTFTTTPPPVYQCDELTDSPEGDADVNGNQNYKLTATASAKDGAKVTSYKFNFNDSTPPQVVNTDALSESVDHIYAPGDHQASVDVYFNANGSAESSSCQVTIKVPPAPIYQCTDLTLTSVTSEQKTVKATVAYNAQNGAKFKEATFIWGKGIKNTVTTSTSAEYTYANYGAKTVQADLTFDVNGNLETVTSNACKKSITFAVPSTACTQLYVNQVADEQLTVQATVKYAAQSGATFKSATFDWGDATSSTVTTSTNSEASNNHIYSAFGTYTITASLIFTINGQDQSPVSSAACQIQEQFTAPTPMCTIPGETNLPSSSPQCTPMCTVPGETNLPSSSPQCTTPSTTTTALVNTGPGDDAAIFGGATAVGTLGHYLIRNRKLFKLWSSIARR